MDFRPDQYKRHLYARSQAYDVATIPHYQWFQSTFLQKPLYL